MKTKRVNRYYCDFCKKSGCAAGHMKKHERRCTMNPERECGVCEMIGNTPEPMEMLIAILPDPEPFKVCEYGGFHAYPGLGESLNKSMPKLRTATDCCPACILAALRQRGIPPYCSDFKYKEEMDEVWTDLNQKAYEEDVAAYRTEGL